MRRPMTLSRTRTASLLCALLTAVLVALGPGVSAAPKYNNSLDWVPADAAFYSASLRNKEQLEIVANSKAWQRVTQIPTVQMAWNLAQVGLHQPGGPAQQALNFLHAPENKELWALIGDSLSTEIVLWGDAKTAEFFDVAMRAFNSMRYSQMGADLNRRGSDKDAAVARTALDALDAQRDRLAVPGFMVALKISDAERAKSQLARLETTLKPLIEKEPRLQGRLKRATVAGNEFVTLEFDGTMIPWEKIDWSEVAEKPGQYDQLQAKLKSLKAVVAIGLWRDYLLVVVGESLAPVEGLGSGKVLAEVAELEPVAKFADRRFTDISYLSKSFMQTMGSAGGGMDDIARGVEQGLSSAPGMTREMKDRIVKDAEELAADLKSVMPEPGALTQFSFLTDQGVEGYKYDWTQNLHYDASKPLDLLNHVGGSPLVAFVSRAKHSPQQWELARKWIKKGFGYMEEFAVPNFGLEERQKYERFKQIARPLVDQLDKATSQMLIPALADGQTGLVVDAKITSAQWFQDFAQGQALPMLEIALAFGVSDAEKLKQAVREYRAVAESLIAGIREIEPDAIPADFHLPDAETTAVKAGSAAATVYGYKLPEDAGIDEQIMPNAGLSQRVAVLSLAPKQTVRMLTDQPLVVTADGPLSDRSKPLAVAAYCNWAGTVDAITPWIDWGVRYGAHKAAGDESQPQPPAGEDDPSTKFILDQVHTVLDFFKTLRTYERATYAEGNAMVTHSLTVYRDVD